MIDGLYLPPKPAIFLPKPQEIVRASDPKFRVPELGGLLINPYNFGGFAPPGAGTLLAWYRADQGITTATGVSQWDDLSGNARHLTQGTGANQPVFGATSGPNSQPSVTFDGTNDSLAVAFSAINQPFHAFAIVKTTAIGTNSNGHLCGGTSFERFLSGNTGGASTYTWFGGAGITLTPHTDTTNFFLWEFLVNGGSSSVTRGATAPLAGSHGATTLTGVTMGMLPGNANQACSFSEVAIYTAAVAGANLTSLRAYFSGRYGVATN